MTSLKTLKVRQRAFYKGLKQVECPVLGESVHFTSSGFNHLIFESNRMPRTVAEQFMKLSCLKYAPEVLKKCASVSEIRPIKRKVNGKLKNGTQSELVYEVMSGMKIGVIVEKIGNGKYHFLSVVKQGNGNRPRTNKKRLKRRS